MVCVTQSLVCHLPDKGRQIYLAKSINQMKKQNCLTVPCTEKEGDVITSEFTQALMELKIELP